MNWLKLAPYIGGAVALGLLFWGYQHQISEAEQRGYDRRTAEEQTEQLAAERRAREEDSRALQTRAEELAHVRALYAARDSSVIRVLIPTPSLPGSAEADGSVSAAAPAAGSLSEGRPQDTVAYFDPTPLDALHLYADEVVAECRAYIARQQATQSDTN